VPPSFPSAVQCEKLLGGYRRHKHRDRNAGSKISREGKDTGRKPKANYQQPRKPLETQGPWPDLKGFCIKALIYRTSICVRCVGCPLALTITHANVLVRIRALPLPRDAKHQTQIHTLLGKARANPSRSHVSMVGTQRRAA
jgi:hypothetical protein